VGLATRLAHAVNRVLERGGQVWQDRCHCRALASPREVRRVTVYVLMNAKKHMASAPNVDPCSSAAWFADWKTPPAHAPPREAPVTRAPETWLLQAGWKRHGLVALTEQPRASS
jgi:hypothetical protein